MSRVLVEGWFGLPHSYSLLLERQVSHWLAEHPQDVLFRRLRFFMGQAERPDASREGPLDEALKTRRWRGEPVTALYRVSHPFNIAPPPSPGATVFLFMTLEAARPNDAMFTGGGVREFQRACADGWLVPVVPSRWCLDMLQGLDLPRVELIPHGADASVFKPEARRRPSSLMPFGEDRFVFLSVGAMTGNKGMGHLVRAFARIRAMHPHAALVVKGLDSLYRSSELFAKALSDVALSEEDRSAIHITGAELDEAELASLYASADAYVAPYSAEGFCLPALEALASGVPVIASAGGATDDFLRPELEASIAIRTTPVDEGQVRYLAVDEPNLAQAMERVMTDTVFRENARARGPRFVAREYPWAEMARRQWELFASAGATSSNICAAGETPKTS